MLHSKVMFLTVTSYEVTDIPHMTLLGILLDVRQGAQGGVASTSRVLCLDATLSI